MKFTVQAIDKNGTEKSLTVEAESKEAVEKGLTTRGYTNLRFVESNDGLTVNESAPVAPIIAPTPTAAPVETKPAPVHPAPVKSSSWLAEFMSFKTLVTATYIGIIWWVGCILITVSMLITAVGLLLAGAATGPGIIVAILGVIFGIPIAWAIWIFVFRICCEFLIVIFRIYEELRDANQRAR